MNNATSSRRTISRTKIVTRRCLKPPEAPYLLEGGWRRPHVFNFQPPRAVYGIAPTSSTACGNRPVEPTGDRADE
jgi:hypothetical protein